MPGNKILQRGFINSLPWIGRRGAQPEHLEQASVPACGGDVLLVLLDELLLLCLVGLCDCGSVCQGVLAGFRLELLPDLRVDAEGFPMEHSTGNSRHKVDPHTEEGEPREELDYSNRAHGFWHGGNPINYL